MRIRRHALLLLFVTLTFAACGDSPTDPALSDLAGEYRATTLDIIPTVVQGDSVVPGDTIDALAQGAELEVELLDGGDFTGRLFVPAELAGEDMGDLAVDLAGTWELSTSTTEGETVRFETAVSLLGDTPFHVREDGGLEGEYTAGEDGSIRVVLTRQ